jgi:hypothetical protein
MIDDERTDDLCVGGVNRDKKGEEGDDGNDDPTL